MQLKRTWIAAAIIAVIAIPGATRVIGGRSGRARADTPVAQDFYLTADLSDKRLKMFDHDTLVWQYPIAVGQPQYPTPPGKYTIRKLTWNPSWTPPPNSAWAKKYKPTDPGDPKNPMKVVKIFFHDPDFYIHGTNDIRSLGKAESHGCLRMDPEHVAEVAKFVMEHGGQPREE